MATPKQLAWLQSVVPMAQAAQRRYGVPASISLAQAITESTWGTSSLATKANNYFGIKATHTANPESYVEFPTHEYQSGRLVLVEALFERYASEEASFEAHAALLANSARYAPAMRFAHNPLSFAGYLQRCGYSTNPRYASDLMEFVHDYNLTQYDLPEPPAAERQAAA